MGATARNIERFKNWSGRCWWLFSKYSLTPSTLHVATLWQKCITLLLVNCLLAALPDKTGTGERKNRARTMMLIAVSFDFFEISSSEATVETKRSPSSLARVAWSCRLKIWRCVDSSLWVREAYHRDATHRLEDDSNCFRKQSHNDKWGRDVIDSNFFKHKICFEFDLCCRW